MSRTPGIRTVVRAISSTLIAHQSDIHASLLRIQKGIKPPKTFPYFTTNIDTGMYPCTMIAQEEESRSWIGMPSIAQDQFCATIWGLVQYDKPDVLDDLVGEYAACVRDCLNQRHLPIDVDGGFQIFFNDVCPVGSIRYGIPSFVSAGPNVRGFSATWMSHVDIEVKDERL